MANTEVKETIWLSRCSRYTSFLPMVFYLPVGLCLGVVRFFIFIHACLLSYILPRNFPFKRLILRAMLAVTGLPISIQGRPPSDNKKKVFIANHVSNLDPFILALLNPLILSLESPSSLLSTANRKLNTFSLPGDKDHCDVVQEVKAKIAESEVPLLFFPERVKTNGKKSILKFSSLPFELDCPIQPVTIQAYRYLFNIHVSTHSSNLLEDIAWCFLTPLTLFQIRYLPVTERKQDEQNHEFVTRVQQNMARSLGLTASELTYHDVIEHIKSFSVKGEVISRRSTNVPQRNPKPTMSQESIQKPSQTSAKSSDSENDSEMNRMVKQVQDVLQDVPSQCIINDLRITKDVDATIANILDGKVDTSTPKEVTNKPSTSLSEGVAFKASSFASNAHGRQLSFQERKKAMLEAARLKYKLKHGL